jgi:hypothetical protein
MKFIEFEEFEVQPFVEAITYLFEANFDWTERAYSKTFRLAWYMKLLN